MTTGERQDVTRANGELLRRRREFLAEQGREERDEPNPFAGVLERARKLHDARAKWDESPPPAAETYQCRGCHDAMFVKHPETGRAVLCPMCGEQRLAERRRALIMERWPVSESADLVMLARREFQTAYLPEMGEEHAAELERAYHAARAFAQEWPGTLLSFDGTYGAGKTLLLAKIYRHAVMVGERSAIYITGPAFERRMLNFSGPDSDQQRDNLISDLTFCDVLLVDEADRMKEGDNSWGWRHMFDVIDTRLRAERGTVLAGNNLAERLPGAVRSRAQAASSVFVTMNVIDARPLLG